MKFARRLALISPEALYASKLAISRGADVAGFRNAHAGRAGHGGAAVRGEERGGRWQFTDMTRKQGLRAALQWRRDQFDAIEREE